MKVKMLRLIVTQIAEKSIYKRCGSNNYVIRNMKPLPFHLDFV